MDVSETTQAAVNVVPHQPEESPSQTRAEDSEQHGADAADNNHGEYTSSRDDGTSEAATGDKRKRGNEAGGPGDGIKRQMIALPFRGRAAVAPPSYQEQQILIGGEVQTSNLKPGKSQESLSPPSENLTRFRCAAGRHRGAKVPWFTLLFGVNDQNFASER
jgi:hypothetical protein